MGDINMVIALVAIAIYLILIEIIGRQRKRINQLENKLGRYQNRAINHTVRIKGEHSER